MSQPIEERVARLENRQRDTDRTLDLHMEMLRELSHKSDTHTQSLQALVGIMTSMSKDLTQLQIKVNAVDGRAIAIENTISAIEEKIATIDHRVTAIENKVIMIEDKVSNLQADVISIKATQSDHGELLRQILSKLP